VYIARLRERILLMLEDYPNRKIIKILTIFYEIGFRQFGFTGGEPLLKKI